MVFYSWPVCDKNFHYHRVKPCHKPATWFGNGWNPSFLNMTGSLLDGEHDIVLLTSIAPGHTSMAIEWWWTWWSSHGFGDSPNLTIKIYAMPMEIFMAFLHIFPLSWLSPIVIVLFLMDNQYLQLSGYSRYIQPTMGLSHIISILWELTLVNHGNIHGLL